MFAEVNLSIPAIEHSFTTVSSILVFAEFTNRSSSDHILVKVLRKSILSYCLSLTREIVNYDTHN